MSFDTRCYDLAEVFLQGTPFDDEWHKNTLAQDIQGTIEITLSYWESLSGRKRKPKNA